MQFRIPLTPQPKQGDTKSILRFALFPHDIGNVRLWLESYEVLYTYEMREVSALYNGAIVKSYVGNWTKVTERRIRVPKTMINE